MRLALLVWLFAFVIGWLGASGSLAADPSSVTPLGAVSSVAHSYDPPSAATTRFANACIAAARGARTPLGASRSSTFLITSSCATKAGRGAADDVAGAACSFSGETLVLMADGTKKPMSQIRVGDKVIATDPETGKRSIRAVTHLWNHQDELASLVLGGETLTTTEDHPFWNATDEAWERADELDPGDRVLTANGGYGRVDRFQASERHRGAAYNLTVEGVHTYHVGNAGVLVHNFAGCGRLTSRQARETLDYLGVDTRRVVGRVKQGEPVYRLPDGRYITRDIDGHNPPGAFKTARKLKDLGSRSRREGTYGLGPNGDLVRVGP